MSWREWNSIFLVTLTVNLLLVTFLSIAPSSPSYGQSLQQALNSTISSNFLNTSESIWSHNYLLSLGMEIPAVGVGVGLFILGNTGYAFSALGSAGGFPGYLGVAGEMFLPFFWMELLSYSAMMTESLELVIAYRRGKWREEVRRATTLAVIVGVVLFLSALVETGFISVGTSLLPSGG